MRNLMTYAEECMEELDNLGIKYRPARFKVLNKNVRRFGRCKKIYDDMFNEYEIEIRSVLLDEKNSIKGLKDTIIHELLHTVEGCMNHGKKWKKLASLVNEKYGYNVSRCNSYEEKGICQEDIDSIFAERNAKLALKPTYIIRCEKCGYEYTRHKISRLVTEPEHYMCGRCHGKLVRFA